MWLGNLSFQISSVSREAQDSFQGGVLLEEMA